VPVHLLQASAVAWLAKPHFARHPALTRDGVRLHADDLAALGLHLGAVAGGLLVLLDRRLVHLRAERWSGGARGWARRTRAGDRVLVTAAAAAAAGRQQRRLINKSGAGASTHHGAGAHRHVVVLGEHPAVEVGGHVVTHVPAARQTEGGDGDFSWRLRATLPADLQETRVAPAAMWPAVRLQPPGCCASKPVGNAPSPSAAHSCAAGPHISARSL